MLLNNFSGYFLAIQPFHALITSPRPVWVSITVAAGNADADADAAADAAAPLHSRSALSSAHSISHAL